MKHYIAIGVGFYISFCGICICQVSEPHGELLFEDTITLMPKHEYITIPSPVENVWQIGKANKNYLDSSLSGQSVIITDTINSYPPSVDDHFLLSIPKYEHYAYWPEAILSFYHRYHTDSLLDGGIIEISYDNGESWENVLYDDGNVFNNFIGLYKASDTIDGGIPAFSGSSNDWIYTELHWVWLALVKKSKGETESRPILKFRFVSDSVDNKKDGWLIDQIVFRGYDVSGAVHPYYNKVVKVYPNPFSDFLYIDVQGMIGRGLLKLYSIDGKLQLQTDITNSARIDVTSMSKGIYFFTLFQDNQLVASGKLFKK